jgi:sigma-B regulation protein RsbU (phosphoserine phosphatase)
MSRGPGRELGPDREGMGQVPQGHLQVLVVDDEDSVRKVLVIFLKRLGYACREAVDGADALDQLRSSPAALVLCDLRMPRMDGLEFLAAVREEFPQLPVIVMSGAGVFGDAVNALKLGAWDYVTKPITELGVLDHAVRKALEKASLLEENRRYREHLEAANSELAESLRRLADDESAARQLQFRLLPPPLQSFGSFVVSRTLVPSGYMSGDFIDAFPIGPSHFGFYVADVAGHGASSALVTMILRTLVQRHLASFLNEGDDTILSPARLLGRLNSELLSQELEKHASMFLGVIDVAANTLAFANAGHFPWPVLFDGEHCSRLELPGAPLGLFPNFEYRELTVALPSDMLLTVCSDGLLENLPRGGLAEREGELEALFSSLSLTLADAVETLGLRGPRPLPDDVALLLIKRGGRDGPVISTGRVRPD